MKNAACILRRVPNPRAQVGMEYEEFVSQIQLAIIGWRMGKREDYISGDMGWRWERRKGPWAR